MTVMLVLEVVFELQIKKMMRKKRRLRFINMIVDEVAAGLSVELCLYNIGSRETREGCKCGFISNLVRIKLVIWGHGLLN